MRRQPPMPTGSLPWTCSAPGYERLATRRSARHSAGTRSPSSADIAPPDITPTCYTSISTLARANGARAVSCARDPGEALADLAPTDQLLLDLRLTTRKDLPW